MKAFQTDVSRNILKSLSLIIRKQISNRRFPSKFRNRTVLPKSRCFSGPLQNAKKGWIWPKLG